MDAIGAEERGGRFAGRKNVIRLPLHLETEGLRKVTPPFSASLSEKLINSASMALQRKKALNS
jgi:hypothetical protein